MKYKELISGYGKKGYNLISYGTVKEDKDYNLYKIIINNNSQKTVLVTTGFHGEEFNGPISILKIIDEIKQYSKFKKVNLIIYICINPSGFEKHKRYNLSDESPNNDFLRFLEIARGSLEETKYHLILSKDLEYFDIFQFNELYNLSDEVGKMLYSLKQKLSNSSNR